MNTHSAPLTAPISAILYKPLLRFVCLTIVCLLLSASSNINNKTIFVDQPYASALDVVIAASDRFNPDSMKDDREYMGTILLRNGHYYYTYTRGRKGNDSVSILLPRTASGTVVAFWHTRRTS